MITNLCFVTTHPNPANHFVEYVQTLEEKGIPCQVIAGKNVSEKFSNLRSKVTVIDENEDLLSQISPNLKPQTLVISDIATEKWADFYAALKTECPKVKKAVYYDNPESFVPGGYSEVAAKVIAHVDTVYFANQGLLKKGVESAPNTPIDLSNKKLIGLGYYPKEDAKKILALKNDPAYLFSLRADLFSRHGIQDTHQQIVVYTGGANEVYYHQAFPHFVEILSNLAQKDPAALENKVFILQQHPRAKKEGNLDALKVQDFLEQASLPKNFNFIISDISTFDAMSLASAVLYYQTSMAAQFAFGNVPIIAQVGHDTYNDILIRSGYPSIHEAKSFKKVLKSQNSKIDLTSLEKELGIDINWKEKLVQNFSN